MNLLKPINLRYMFSSWRFLLILAVVVLASYGQTLLMGVWEDDNALFFKLAHLQDPAGFLGAGPLGEGAYKYTAAFYVPIYYLFGFNVFFYFLYGLLFYVVSVFVVYKVYSKILGDVAGKAAGFIYACGFIASDGYIRLFNSIITSISIILISFLFLFLYRFYQQVNFVKSNFAKQYTWYFLALGSFFLALELARARTHYLFSIILIFELFFLINFRRASSILASFLRIIPFSIIFTAYFVLGADSRSERVGDLFYSLLKGDFYKLFSFFATLGNLIIPRKIIDILLEFQNTANVFSFHPLPWGKYLGAGIIIGIFILAFGKKIISLWGVVFIVLMGVWYKLSGIFFQNIVLNLGERSKLLVFLSGGVLIFGFVIAKKLSNEKRRMFLFLSLWMLLNIAAYSSYIPTTQYDTINRYLAHSFFALVGIAGLLLSSVPFSRRIGRLIVIVILGWGIGNLIQAIGYQNYVLNERTFPVGNFYKQLKVYLPEIKKGDVLYFDVAKDVASDYRNAVVAAQMPDTTSIAWRYGIDRYDFKMFSDFNSFHQEVNQNTIDVNKIFSFFYSKNGLVDTTERMRSLSMGVNSKNIAGKFPLVSKVKLFSGNDRTTYKQPELVIEFNDEVSGLTPAEIVLDIKATPLNSDEIKFPLISETWKGVEVFDADDEKKSLLADYFNSKRRFLETVIYNVSSEWKERIVRNLHDGDSNSFWQPNRILWSNNNAVIDMDLGKETEIAGVVWINTFANNTPTKYDISVSTDGLDWRLKKSVEEQKRIETREPQVILFDSEKIRYIKIAIKGTLNSDAPVLSEVWPLEAKFVPLNITMAHRYIQKPLSFISTKESFLNTLVLFGRNGVLKFGWMNDKFGDWATNDNSYINLKYDGNIHSYKILIPAGGTRIRAIRLAESFIPADISIMGIKVKEKGLLEKYDE